MSETPTPPTLEPRKNEMQSVRNGNTASGKSENKSTASAGYKVGDRIRFYGERRRYTVQAVSASGRYLACTKPFAVYGPTAVVYTVVDLVEGLRGVDDSIGNSLGYETREDCERSLALFEDGSFGYSRRSAPIPLLIVAGDGVVHMGPQVQEAS
jgi:hypothetical protein